MDPELTLVKVKKRIRQKEAIHLQQGIELMQGRVSYRLPPVILG